MGLRYLIDTNILIYVLNGSFNANQQNWLVQQINAFFAISVISKMEFLGWKNHTEISFKQAEQFIANATVLDINQSIVEQTIDMKRKQNLKLPDAIIAATCLVHGLDLVTRNVDDFKHIPNLTIINPFDI